MSLQIICGRSHSGKSTYLTDLIKQKAQSGEKVMLVVPEQFTHAAEVRVLRSVGKIQDNLLEITSFKRLANHTCYSWRRAQRYHFSDRQEPCARKKS